MSNKKIEPPIIHDWHRPRNDACPQNRLSFLDCECEKPKRKRKPYRTWRAHDAGVPHGTKPDIIMELHQPNRLFFREKGRPRRTGYMITIGEIYSRLVMNEALVKLRAKKAAKRKRRR